MEFCKFCLHVFGETLRVSKCNSQTGVSDAAICRVTVLWRCNRLSLTLTLKQSTDQSVPKKGTKARTEVYRFGLHDSGVIRWGYVFSLSVRDALRIGLVRGTAITWCVCVCLSVNPNPKDVLGIRQYIAKYRDITIPPKLGRSKIRPSSAKL